MDIVQYFRAEFASEGMSAEALEQGLKGFLGTRPLELSDFASLARLIGGSFGASMLSSKTVAGESLSFQEGLPWKPEEECLLPKLHEHYEQTHLLKLVLRLDVTDSHLVRSFPIKAWDTLPAEHKQKVKKEQQILYALAKDARAILPDLKNKVRGDMPILLRLTDYLPKEWRLYYHTVVDAGLRSLLQGMGIGGYTEDDAFFEEDLHQQKIVAKERERLASPLVAILVCVFLRGDEENPLKHVMRALTLDENRYGLSFSGIPGRGNITFPKGGAPPAEILEQKRVCTGVAYVEALCLYALNCFKRRHSMPMAEILS